MPFASRLLRGRTGGKELIHIHSAYYVQRRREALAGGGKARSEATLKERDVGVKKSANSRVLQTATHIALSLRRPPTLCEAKREPEARRGAT